MSEAPYPGARDAINALALITRLPLPPPPFTGEPFARAALFFPAIGMMVGAALVGTAGLLVPLVGVDLAVAVLIVLWEAFGTPTTSPETMPQRWRIPAEHAAPLLAALALKAWLLLGAGGLLYAALLFAPILGRWSVVVLAVGARSADRTDHKFSPAVTFREFGVASLLAFAFVFTIGQFVGLVLIVITGAVTLVLRLAFHRWQGGVTWTTVIAGMHVVEISALGVLAVLG